MAMRKNKVLSFSQKAEHFDIVMISIGEETYISDTAENPPPIRQWTQYSVVSDDSECFTAAARAAAVSCKHSHRRWLLQ